MTSYTIQAGDTLGKIAEKFYGDASRYQEIAEANNIDNPNNIRVGQTINIPDEKAVKTDTPDTSTLVLTASQLKEIMPAATTANINKYLSSLNEKMPEFEINTVLRVCHFIAQIGHESGNFKYSSENLNYGAAGLRATFGKYFPTDELANEYERNPEKIANRVYASRMGNGDEESGDGWKFRGRGLIQLTGFDNYTSCGAGLDIDLVNDPEPLAQNPTAAVQGSGWYWQSRKLNVLADQDDVKEITKRINGGENGLADRESILERAKAVLLTA